LSSRLISKDIKIKIHKTMIVPVVWYGCETYFWHWKRNTGKRYSRMGCWGR